jgi:Tol biopolymer transport system component
MKLLSRRSAGSGGRAKRHVVLLSLFGAVTLLWLIAWLFFLPDVFWSRPWVVSGGFNALADKAETATRDDGTHMVIARDDPGRGSELYAISKAGNVWRVPVALEELNSPFNETDPDLSADGRYLFFASDRPGGLGGFDLWVSQRLGGIWGPPINLGPGVNSRFDDVSPSAPLTVDHIVFSSNRPRTPLTAEDDTLSDKELRRNYVDRDMDVYRATWSGFRQGERPTSYAMRDPRQIDETLIGRLGGSAGTEAAVLRALTWISSKQESDGHWSNAKHGGQANHESGATALSLLCLLGRGHTHTDANPYQESVDKGLTWMLGMMKPNGDLRNGNHNNGMYDQGMATMALAEAYGLSRDPALREPLQRAVDFIVKAQNKKDGGWRYKPGEGGDTSVFGWQVMALSSAQALGINVPDETFEKARSWLKRVSGGKNKGLFGYTGSSPTATMTAEGMFCSQLLGVEQADTRMLESAEFIGRTKLDENGSPFFYYVYYSTLSLYHHHGDTWNVWNRLLKENLLQSQVKHGDLKGTWKPTGKHSGEMGTLTTTALATLALEVYYRYLPRYEYLHPIYVTGGTRVDAAPSDGMPPMPPGYGPSETQKDASIEALRELALKIPALQDARLLAGVSSRRFDDAQPALSLDGKTLVFASNRKGTRGGADIFASRQKRQGYTKPRRLFGHPNSIADETDPVFFADDAGLRFSSNRESPSGQWYRLYEAKSMPFNLQRALLEAFAYVLALMARVKWWLLAALIAGIAIIYLLRRMADLDARRRMTLLQRCLIASLLLHLLGLVSAAFYKISSEVKVAMQEGVMEVAVDVNALAQEKLSLDIREDITEMPDAQTESVAEQVLVPDMPQEATVEEVVTLDSDAVTESFSVETPLPVVDITPDVPDLPLPEALDALDPLEVVLADMQMEERVEQEDTAEPELTETAMQDQISKVEDTFETPAPTPELPVLESEPVEPPERQPEAVTAAEAPTSNTDLPKLDALAMLLEDVVTPAMEMTEKPSKPDESPEPVADAGERADQPDVEIASAAASAIAEEETPELSEDEPLPPSPADAIKEPEEAFDQRQVADIEHLYTNIIHVTFSVAVPLEQEIPQAPEVSSAAPTDVAGHRADPKASEIAANATRPIQNVEILATEPAPADMIAAQVSHRPPVETKTPPQKTMEATMAPATPAAASAPQPELVLESPPQAVAQKETFKPVEAAGHVSDSLPTEIVSDATRPVQDVDTLEVARIPVDMIAAQVSNARPVETKTPPQKTMQATVAPATPAAASAPQPELVLERPSQAVAQKETFKPVEAAGHVSDSRPSEIVSDATRPVQDVDTLDSASIPADRVAADVSHVRPVQTKATRKPALTSVSAKAMPESAPARPEVSLERPAKAVAQKQPIKAVATSGHRSEAPAVEAAPSQTRAIHEQALARVTPNVVANVAQMVSSGSPLETRDVVATLSSAAHQAAPVSERALADLPMEKPVQALAKSAARMNAKAGHQSDAPSRSDAISDTASAASSEKRAVIDSTLSALAAVASTVPSRPSQETRAANAKLDALQTTPKASAATRSFEMQLEQATVSAPASSSASAAPKHAASSATAGTRVAVDAVRAGGQATALTSTKLRDATMPTGRASTRVAPTAEAQKASDQIANVLASVVLEAESMSAALPMEAAPSGAPAAESETVASAKHRAAADVSMPGPPASMQRAVATQRPAADLEAKVTSASPASVAARQEKVSRKTPAATLDGVSATDLAVAPFSVSAPTMALATASRRPTGASDVRRPVMDAAYHASRLSADVMHTSAVRGAVGDPARSARVRSDAVPASQTSAGVAGALMESASKVTKPRHAFKVTVSGDPVSSHGIAMEDRVVKPIASGSSGARIKGDHAQSGVASRSAKIYRISAGKGNAGELAAGGIFMHKASRSDAYAMHAAHGESVAAPHKGFFLPPRDVTYEAEAAPVLLDEPENSVSPYVLRQIPDRKAILKHTGGDDATEAAVMGALAWLADMQEADGRWSMERHGGEGGHDVGATSLALLAYLGWGATHTGDGLHQDSVKRAIDWLVTQSRAKGDFRQPDEVNAMYSQAIATLALTEAFALTRDPELLRVAQEAVNFVVESQNSNDGGWRYYPQEPGDTSVFGWQFLAMKSAKRAGLVVPEQTLVLSSRWLDRVGGGDHGGLYGYRDRNPLASLVSIGLFSRQLMGDKRTDARSIQSVDFLAGRKPDLENDQLPVFYEIYYTTLALYQHQGPEWEAWNTALKPALVQAQEKEGEFAGSWAPRGIYARRAGRIVSTAMAALTLEVYYRYLPARASAPLAEEALPLER